MSSSNDRDPMSKSQWRPGFFAGRAHGHLIYQRRIRAIVHAIAPLIPAGTLLDIGCGNGELASYLMSIRPDIRVVGLEVYLRLRAKIPIVNYSGGYFPLADRAFTCVLIADTLHHIEDSKLVLEESLRVCQEAVIIKDHFFGSRWDQLLLRLLDIGGNAAHGIPSIFNYYSRESWEETLLLIKAHELIRSEEVPGQYPIPFQRLLGRRIQFVSKIVKSSKVSERRPQVISTELQR